MAMVTYLGNVAVEKSGEISLTDCVNMEIGIILATADTSGHANIASLPHCSNSRLFARGSSFCCLLRFLLAQLYDVRAAAARHIMAR